MEPKLEQNPAAHQEPRVYTPAPVLRPEYDENTLTRLVEQQAAKLPSDYFLLASLGAMALSLGYHMSGKTQHSHFVGMWVAPLLIMGVYNKLVKTFGAR